MVRPGLRLEARQSVQRPLGLMLAPFGRACRRALHSNHPPYPQVLDPLSPNWNSIQKQNGNPRRAYAPQPRSLSALSEAETSDLERGRYFGKT